MPIASLSAPSSFPSWCNAPTTKLAIQSHIWTPSLSAELTASVWKPRAPSEGASKGGLPARGSSAPFVPPVGREARCCRQRLSGCSTRPAGREKESLARLSADRASSDPAALPPSYLPPTRLPTTPASPKYAEWDSLDAEPKVELPRANPGRELAPLVRQGQSELDDPQQVDVAPQRLVVVVA